MSTPPGKIGVDQWVAQSGERREQASGLRGVLARVDARVGWWPRLAIAAALGLAFGLQTSNINLLSVGFNSLLYAILSLGLNVAVGWAGLLDLGYIAWFGIGAYAYAVLSSTATGSGGSGGTHLSAFETIPIAIGIAGIAGIAIGLIAARLEGDYFAIVTLFLGQAFVVAVNNVDPNTLGGVNGLFSLDSVHGLSGQISSPRGYYILALIFTVMLAAILHLLDTSRTGRSWRALRDDPLAAGAMTIPVSKQRVMALAFAAMVAGLAGALFAAEQTSVFPTNFNSNILILIYACLVLGGVGSIAGAITGGIVVTVVQQMLSSPTDSAYLFYGLILFALLLKIRPWRYLGAVLAGIVVFGVLANAIVGAISSSATAGSPGSSGWIGSLVSHWVIVPHDPVGYGNILYVLLMVMTIILIRVQGVRRMLLIIPTVWIAACCWEARLIVNPSITAQIMIGAILIVTMAARPNGLLGTRQVEIA